MNECKSLLGGSAESAPGGELARAVAGAELACAAMGHAGGFAEKPAGHFNRGVALLATIKAPALPPPPMDAQGAPITNPGRSLHTSTCRLNVSTFGGTRGIYGVLRDGLRRGWRGCLGVYGMC